MLGLGPRSSCRGGFKKSDILIVPSVYIAALTEFVVRNSENFQSNSSVHRIDIRQKNQLRLPSMKFSLVQKGIAYSSIKIFIKLPLKILKHHRGTITFKSVLR